MKSTRRVTRATFIGAFRSARGLTGNKVNVLVDGVRYSTGAQRGGVNTFLDLIGQVTSCARGCARDRTSMGSRVARWLKRALGKAKVNHQLNDPDKIKPGQVLRLP